MSHQGEHAKKANFVRIKSNVIGVGYSNSHQDFISTFGDSKGNRTNKTESQVVWKFM